MKVFWLALSGVCIVVAGVFIWLGDVVSAFVVAVIGILAWFLNYRIQMKEVADAADLEDEKRYRDEADDDVV
ncbi:MAG TPA: hypothetical protein VMM84_10760 [Pyrinomonadaceae bacterium]|nr:hypothetical protein [Pyrinomonadaceae bacterium]